MESSFIPYTRDTYLPAEMAVRSRAFYQWLGQRRSLRSFSDAPVPREVIESLILAAGTAPSGAHKQPWTFCAVSDPDLKRRIREAAEEEEYRNYHGRMSDAWLQDLQPFGTDWHKPFLETAPWLIVVFRRIYELEAGQKRQNYYVQESVGLACGLLLAAIHHAGLAALTHTPSPMNFLSEVLGRPDQERPFLLIPVGYPAPDAAVPNLRRKGLDEIAVWYESSRSGADIQTNQP
ncbi:MAG: nitroreductase family protein [Bacteroidia bacterium]|nr:nitroreductase family protein [Bacteroidia bacterium]